MKRKGDHLKKIIIFSLIFLLTGFFSGCAWRAKKEPQPTPQEMYNNGLKLLNNKKYEQALENIYKII